MNTAKHSNLNQAKQQGITELVVSQGQDQYLDWLLPMVAHFSRAEPGRWLTWIGASDLSKSLLEAYGVDLTHVRFIHLRNDKDCLWTTWEALAAGNSHMVISNPGVISPQEYQQLKQASGLGNCQGLLLRMH
ncbi:MAG: SulA-like leucine-rich domain-containing protein [Cellvibrionaceae bacterium]|nr:SulA-like leucine-rich domain-containing protein [Cellvibrionaceae bacterium]MCV6626449.1 SulA-like leucine-rich domain-containing protein [Cellvibrionaceae bacterium]